MAGLRPPSDSGVKRAKRWNLSVAHALYRKTGDWYHQLERFPGAFLDAEGYVVFETEEGYRSCPGIRIRQDVWVPEGIKALPGYTRVEDNSDLPKEQTTYEKARLFEGARFDVVQSRPERDPTARDACLKKHGYACAACGFDFVKRYGPLGERYIHVHHLTPLANGEREVDPLVDMRPLCPNCHAMVHRGKTLLSIDDLRSLIKSHES